MTYAGNAGDVWAVADYVSDVRMNAKTIAVMTGAAIAALDITPTSRYDFEGDGADCVGSNTLTATGSPTYTDGGPFGQYADLGSSNSSKYFQASANTVFDVTTGDFSVWGLFYRSSDSGSFESIIQKYDGGAGGYVVEITSDDILRAGFSDTSTLVYASAAATISTGVWYLWAASFDRSANITLYLYTMTGANIGAYEAATVDISGKSGSATNTDTFSVGSNGGGAYFPGRIDDLNFLSGTAITEAQFLIIAGSLRPGMTVKCSKSENGFVKENLYQRNIEGTQWQPVGTFRGSGSDIAALITNKMTYPGLPAFCTSTGSGYTAGITYRMNNSGTFDGIVDDTNSQTITNKALGSGTTITSATVVSNNVKLQAKNSGGTARTLIYRDSSNVLQVGDTSQGTGVQINEPITMVAGDVSIIANDTERTSTSTSLTKMKESSVGLAGQFRIKFDAKYDAAGGGTGTAQIYKNGSAVGTSRNLTTTYTTYSEDITGFAAGDLIQVYGMVSNGASTVAIKNFRIYGAYWFSASATSGS